MVETVKETYFIASASCYEVKFFDGTIATNENEIMWLAKIGELPTCSPHKNLAYNFSSVDEIKLCAKKWDGMPWYCRLKPDTLRIFKIIKTTIEEYTEEEV
jgi:hypothetical protein